MQYGKLTLIKQVDNNKRGDRMFECSCEYGKTTVAKLANLKSGTTQSCGCIRTGPKPVDLSGQKFGRLLVLGAVGQTKWRNTLFECKCDCGVIKVVGRRTLVAGSTKSCGCLKVENDKSRVGPKSPTFNPLLTAEDRKKFRGAPGLAAWRTLIKSKGKCEVCTSPESLVAHHIESWKNSPELRTEPTNGACLCFDCHTSFHKKYGRGGNNRTQYMLFLEWAKTHRPVWNADSATLQSLRTSKQCIKCQTDKVLEEFVRSNHTLDHRTNICKVCANARARWKLANLPKHREGVLRSQRKSYRKHKAKTICLTPVV
jgi:hypothetical protein